MLKWMLVLPAVAATGPCGPTSTVCCSPTASPPQICPGNVPCAPCGGSVACECAAPAPAPSGPISDTRLTIVNGCQNNDMWVAHLVAGGVGPDPQDVFLAPGASAQFHTGLNGGGLAATRFWPKVGCNANGTDCTIGSSGGPGEGCVVRHPRGPDDYSRCAPPVDTKLEGTFAKPGSGVLDTIDMSLVDGFTLPFTVEVNGGACMRHGKPFTGMDCSTLTFDDCPSADYLHGSTADLRAVNPRNGQTGGCYSPCTKLTNDKWNATSSSSAPDSARAAPYCCAGLYGNPGECSGGPIQETRYLAAVRAKCPAAYGYAYDDKTATITCTPTTNYTVTFLCA